MTTLLFSSVTNGNPLIHAKIAKSGNNYIKVHFDLANFMHYIYLLTTANYCYKMILGPTSLWDWPFPDFQVKNTTVHHNQLGVVTRHYNQPSNEYLDVFFR